MTELRPYTVWIYERENKAVGRSHIRLYHSRFDSGIARATHPDLEGTVEIHPPTWVNPDAFVTDNTRLIGRAVLDAPSIVALNRQVARFGLVGPFGAMEKAELLLDMAVATDQHDLAVDAGTLILEVQARLRRLHQLLGAIGIEPERHATEKEQG